MKRAFLAASAALALTSCGSDSTAPPGQTTPQPDPGEVCDPQNTATLVVHFDPPSIVLAPGESRPVKMLVDPDVCTATPAIFTTDNAAVAAAPANGNLDLRHATYEFTVQGGAVGTANISAAVSMAATAGSGTLSVDVRNADVPTCAAGDGASGTFKAGADSLAGTGSLVDASMTFPDAAFTVTNEYSLPAFPATIACATDIADQAPGGLVKLGPAVTYGAAAPLNPNKVMRREMELKIPVNPAAIPSAGRIRHLQVVYSSPMAKSPRVVTVANPRIEKQSDNNYAFVFSTPWFGTYQVATTPDAGTIHRKRHLTHRAVIGFSMGGGGAATFGMRHHDQFDVIGALGGPSDWSWLMWFIEQYETGGFCPASNPSCTKYAPNMYPIDEPFAHTDDFEHWWSQNGSGTGGHFPRSEYVQIFTDLALMPGNPNGQNADPLLSYLARGPKATDPFVTGDTTGLPPGTSCQFTLEPLGPDHNAQGDLLAQQQATQKLQQQIAAQCNQSRCDPANVWKAPTGYFDATFNPDGQQQVISFCDGAQIPGDDTNGPNATYGYEDTWVQPTTGPGGNAVPVDFALAVDLNKNGIRDQGEPIIRQGHEPWSDTGVDGKADADEPGYDALTNPDPSQDDYDPQINPNGTENNHTYEQGEPFSDFGLDGVANTAFSNPYGDVGEGDGKYTMSQGLQNWYAIDPHRIIHQTNTNLPAGPLDDNALRRISILSDGGVRDIFNFESVARHLEGAIASRTDASGRQLVSTAFYNGFEFLPGGGNDPDNFVPQNILWNDIAGMPSVRYGDIDASPQKILLGDGQHVGTALQILDRLQTAFFFVGKTWPDADRRQTLPSTTDDHSEKSTKNELGVDCEISGTCEKIFTGPKTGRTGPIAVTLPPGYALDYNANVTYPVLYVLHGYGQDPRDLEALAIFTNNFMNDGLRSYATRLPKFIVVYVDGRCRDVPDPANPGSPGFPECVQGTFYLNSQRPADGAKPQGVQLDDWFDEVVDYVDQNYRTMPSADVDVTD